MFNVTIKFRLIATMAVMAAMLTVGGLMGVFGVRSNNAIIQNIFTNQLPGVEYSSAARMKLLEANVLLYRSLAHTDATELDQTIAEIEAAINQSDEIWNHFIKLEQDESEIKMISQVTSAKNTFVQEGFKPIIADLKAGNKEKLAQINFPALKQMSEAYSKELSALIEHQIKSAEQGLESSKSDFKVFAWLDVLGVTMGLLAVAISTYLLLRAISKPLHFVLHQLSEIGKGNLSNQVETTSQDEMGQLLMGLESMRQNLVQTVSVVREGSASIAMSSHEIASGNMDLSARTENQAASLEETASSMEELTATVQQNAENARQGNTLACSASEVAIKGGRVVDEVVDTMDSIKKSSKRIVDIIGVIDSIAFQTNILALNAAVEAARAGEQGRGFAVVATEVRNLAQRSASAAKEIKQLIQDSVIKVETGSRLVDEAGQTMHEIVTSIKGVADIMAEITMASAEQSDGIAQINVAVSKMDEVTQQNAALVEQAAAAASSMQEQATSLNEAVSSFKLSLADSMNQARSVMPSKTNKTNKTNQVNFAKNNVSSMTRKPSLAMSAKKSATNQVTSRNDDWEEF